MDLNEPFEGHEHATTSLKVVLLVFAIVLVGALAYLIQATYNQPEATEEVAPSVKDKTEETTATEAEETTTIDETASWKTYTNAPQAFSIKYPDQLSGASWEYKVLEVSGQLASVGFRPTTLKNDYQWMVNVYAESMGLETLIKEIGSQFSDRKEQREDIKIDGLSAKLVTVTTPSVKDWVQKNVFITSGAKIYSIGNGAIDTAPYGAAFELHYKSFKVTE